MKEHETRSERVVAAAIGILFVGIAVVVMFTAASENPLGAYAVAFVVGALGIDALVSAFLGRRSLLSRIGPLP